MTMPNFIIIGSGKCGTTSLYHYLNQHPDIFMSPMKETNFFSFEEKQLDFRGIGDYELTSSSVTKLKDYEDLFKSVTNEHAIGEASPVYIYDENTPTRIKNYIPNAKIIAILRDPSDRAFSNYMSRFAKGFEPITDFSTALAMEDKRKKDNWSFMFHYRSQGFYYSMLKRYYDLFDADQIKILFFSDLKERPNDLLKDVFEFLGVDSNFKPDTSTILNPSGAPKHPRLYRFILSTYRNDGIFRFIKPILKPLIPKSYVQKIRTKLLSNKMLAKTTLKKEERKQLIDTYRDDILKLQELVNKDLSSWLKE